MILTIKTDTSQAEIGLQDEKIVDSISWDAGRQLSEQILLKIDELLEKNSLSADDLKGIVIFQGPGSFTGLRIAFSVANTYAYALNLSIKTAQGEDWVSQAASQLEDSYSAPVVPFYGGEANITQPKK